MKMILDTHCHTIASGHAYCTIKEYVDEAIEKKLELIAITDHAPNMPGSAFEYYFGNIWTLPKEIKGLEVLAGVELNIMDSKGTVDLKNEHLKKLDLVIASLHIPCIEPSTKEENTAAVINTMDNPYIHIIGHLGDPRYPIDVTAIVEKAKETEVIIELNNSSLIPGAYRSGGDECILEMLKLCKKLEVPITVASDAHFYSYIGWFDYAEKMLQLAEFPERLVLNTSKERLKEKLIIRRKKYGIA